MCGGSPGASWRSDRRVTRRRATSTIVSSPGFTPGEIQGACGATGRVSADAAVVGLAAQTALRHEAAVVQELDVEHRRPPAAQRDAAHEQAAGVLERARGATVRANRRVACRRRGIVRVAAQRALELAGRDRGRHRRDDAHRPARFTHPATWPVAEAADGVAERPGRLQRAAAVHSVRGRPGEDAKRVARAARAQDLALQRQPGPRRSHRAKARGRRRRPGALLADPEQHAVGREPTQQPLREVARQRVQPRVRAAREARAATGSP